MAYNAQINTVFNCSWSNIVADKYIRIQEQLRFLYFSHDMEHDGA